MFPFFTQIWYVQVFSCSHGSLVIWDWHSKKDNKLGGVSLKFADSWRGSTCFSRGNCATLLLGCELSKIAVEIKINTCFFKRSLLEHSPFLVGQISHFNLHLIYSIGKTYQPAMFTWGYTWWNILRSLTSGAFLRLSTAAAAALANAGEGACRTVSRVKVPADTLQWARNGFCWFGLNVAISAVGWVCKRNYDWGGSKKGELEGSKQNCAVR